MVKGQAAETERRQTVRVGHGGKTSMTPTYA